MGQFSEHDLTDAVIERLAECDDPRFATVMRSLIRHLHDFVRDVELTEAEWFTAIQFLTEGARRAPTSARSSSCSRTRSGVSMLVDAINHRMPHGRGRDSTVLGPCYWKARRSCRSARTSARRAGEPAFYSGRVLTPDGAPIAGGAARRLVGRRRRPLRHADAGADRMHAAASSAPTPRAATGSARSARPTTRCPTDGPVGKMLARWAAIRTARGTST